MHMHSNIYKHLMLHRFSTRNTDGFHPTASCLL